jgi:ABC-type nitrate/sulfonate/bicarbonate transport system substrate-binding protein
MGAALTIDVVAAIKEALRESDVRDQIRAIVLEVSPPPANDVDDLLDARAAASFLGMTPAALRMAVYRGTIPCLRVGRRLRFRRSELASR